MRIEMRSNAPAFGCNGICYAENYCNDIQSMLKKGVTKLGCSVEDTEILDAVKNKLECKGDGSAPYQIVKKLYTQVFHDSNWASILFPNNKPPQSPINPVREAVAKDNQLSLFA